MCVFLCIYNIMCVRVESTAVRRRNIKGAQRPLRAYAHILFTQAALIQRRQTNCDFARPKGACDRHRLRRWYTRALIYVYNAYIYCSLYFIHTCE